MLSIFSRRYMPTP